MSSLQIVSTYLNEKSLSLQLDSIKQCVCVQCSKALICRNTNLLAVIRILVLLVDSGPLAIRKSLLCLIKLYFVAVLKDRTTWYHLNANLGKNISPFEVTKEFTFSLLHFQFIHMQ